jgi:hypothetical protein
VFVQVLLQRRGGSDVADLDVRHEVVEHALAVELDHEHAPTRGQCGAGENSRYRGLPDSTFAGDDHESRVEHARGDRLGQGMEHRHWISGGTACADY